MRGWIFRLPDSVSKISSAKVSKSNRIFLVCPGNAGDIPKRLEFIKLLLSAGASVFTYEPRGFGKSEGVPTIAHEKVAFLKIYASWLFPHNPALNNVAILERPHVPLLIMHGAMDSIIDIDHSREMFSRALAPKRFVVCPRSSHVNVDLADVMIFRGAIKQFLNQLN